MWSIEFAALILRLCHNDKVNGYIFSGCSFFIAILQFLTPLPSRREAYVLFFRYCWRGQQRRRKLLSSFCS